MKKLIKNYIYNLLYQILIMIIPLLLLPYLSRTIGAEGTGIYSYTYTIAQYFVLFAMLGMKNYGIRTIAKFQDNKKERSNLFFSLYCMQAITAGISLVFYIIYTTFLAEDIYKKYLYIQLVYVFSTILDISWYFSGVENFKKILIRNIIVKLFTILLIFIFVKNEDDVWIYTLIMALSYLVGNLIFWIKLKKEVDFHIPKLTEIKVHFLPNLKLFIAVIAVSVYTMMDKIMIEVFSNVTELGFYEYAEKINYLQILIISAFGTVMLPRMSNMVEQEEDAKVIANVNKSLEFIMFISCALSFGIMVVSETFIPIYLGDNFIKTIILLQILCISSLFVSWGNVIRTQYLIPKEKDNIYITSVMLGAIINFVVNLILIPKFQAVGACIATVFAEVTVMLYQSIRVIKEISLWSNVKKIIPFMLKAIVMAIIIYPIKFVEINKIVIIVLQIFLGAAIYLGLNTKYIIRILNLKKIFGKRNLNV